MSEPAYTQNHSCPSHYTAISDQLSWPEALEGGRGVNIALSPLVNNTNTLSHACTLITHQSGSFLWYHVRHCAWQFAHLDLRLLPYTSTTDVVKCWAHWLRYRLNVKPHLHATEIFHVADINHFNHSLFSYLPITAAQNFALHTLTLCQSVNVKYEVNIIYELWTFSIIILILITGPISHINFSSLLFYKVTAGTLYWYRAVPPWTSTTQPHKQKQAQSTTTNIRCGKSLWICHSMVTQSHLGQYRDFCELKSSLLSAAVLVMIIRKKLREDKHRDGHRGMSIVGNSTLFSWIAQMEITVSLC